MFEEKIQFFLSACETDATLREFAQKQSVSLRYRITAWDLDDGQAEVQRQYDEGDGHAEDHKGNDPVVEGHPRRMTNGGSRGEALRQ